MAKAPQQNRFPPTTSLPRFVLLAAVLVLVSLTDLVAAVRPVYLQMRYISAAPFNAESSIWELDFYLSASFQDATLTDSAFADGTDISTLYPSDTIPTFEFLNSYDAAFSYTFMWYSSAAPSVLVHPGVVSTAGLGWIFFDSRVRGHFYADVGNSREFPYDSRSVQVVVEASNLDDSGCTLILNPDNNFAVVVNQSTLAGWQVDGTSVSTYFNWYDYYQAGYSRATFSMQVGRMWNRLVMQLVVGLFLLFLIQLTAFCVKPSHPARLHISLVSFVGIIIFMVLSGLGTGVYDATRVDRYHLLVALLVTINALYHGFLAKVLCDKPTVNSVSETEMEGVQPKAAAGSNDAGGEAAPGASSKLTSVLDLVLFAATAITFIVAASVILRAPKA